MKTFAIIKTDNTIEICSVDPEKEYDFLSGSVGGYIEQVSFTDELTMWVNEEVKLNGLPVNYLATKLWEFYYGPSDVMVGDVVLTGGIDEEGYSISLGEFYVANLKEMV